MADNSTRYGHTSTSGGNQDQPERKDEGWVSRQGGSQSNAPGRKGEPSANRESSGEAREHQASRDRPSSGDRQSADQESQPPGTDQPPRMGGPLGPDPKRPHLPEGVQNNDTQGTGAGGFDRGVNATQIGAVHQGVKPERPREAR